MLAGGRSLGIGAGCPKAIRRGLNVVSSSASNIKSFRVCFRYRIVLADSCVHGVVCSGFVFCFARIGLGA